MQLDRFHAIEASFLLMYCSIALFFYRFSLIVGIFAFFAWSFEFTYWSSKKMSLVRMQRMINSTEQILNNIHRNHNDYLLLFFSSVLHTANRNRAHQIHVLDKCRNLVSKHGFVPWFMAKWMYLVLFPVLPHSGLFATPQKNSLPYHTKK